jgi:hypothetical protein
MPLIMGETTVFLQQIREISLLVNLKLQDKSGKQE